MEHYWNGLRGYSRIERLPIQTSFSSQVILEIQPHDKAKDDLWVNFER